MTFPFLFRYAFAAILLAAVVASQGLKCETVWKGPSPNNDIVDCVTSTERAEKNFGYFVPLAFVVVILGLFFIIFPILCLWCTFCKCCCDCCQDVPEGERDSSRRSRRTVLIVIIIVLVFGVVALGLMLGGAPKVSSGADGIFTNLHTHVLQYFQNVIGHLETIVRDPNNGDLTEPFTDETMKEARGYIYDIGNSTMKYRNDATTYADLATKVGYGIAVLPLVLVAFTVLFSLCNCRFCLPTGFSCVYYLFFIIFSLLALVLFVIAPLLSALAAEVELQQDRKPGVFQWYVIPYCEAQANFTELKQQVHDKEVELSAKMCEEMSKYCSPTYTYNIANPESVFYCNMTNATRHVDCATFKLAVRVLNNTFTKTGATPCGATNCSFRECANDCVVTEMRDTSKEAIDKINQAERLFDALDYVLPLMDCNLLADRLLMILKTMPEMRDGAWLLGSAFFVAQIMLIIAIVVMLLGAKLWFSADEYEEDAPHHPFKSTDSVVKW